MGARTLNKLLDSLVQQGSEKENSAVLPHWITEGAALSYTSSTSGKAFDVVVDGISHSKQQVRFVFKADRNTWKSVSFQEIVAGRNPLRQRDRIAKPRDAPTTAEIEIDATDDADKFLSSMETKWASASLKPGASDDIGPSSNKLPQMWRQPEVV